MLSLRVAFTGGGTGGHIYPALGIDDALRTALAAGSYERRFFGNRNGLEAKLVTTMPLTFVPSAPLARRPSLAALATFARNIVGVGIALRALAAFRPSCVVATGGYVCFPVVVAARLLRSVGVLRACIALLEINVQPGLTSRLLRPLSDEVWISYSESARYFGAKAVLTGAPVRAALARARTAHDARVALGLQPAGRTIVVMGGSQGAQSINAAVVALVQTHELPPSWQILHVCGERDYASLQQTVPAGALRLVPYLADPGDAYAAADIVVARAGASTLAELALTSKPAILIPYPHAAGGHQAANAAAFAAAGAALVIRDAELGPARLLEALHACLDDGRLATMRAAAASLARPDAAAKIVDRITALLAPRVADSRNPNEVARD